MPTLNIDATYGIIVLKEFELVYVDDHYAQIFGYASAEELTSSIDSFLELIAPQYHQMARDNYYQQVNGCITPRGRTFKNIDRFGREITVFTIDHVIEWEGEPAVQVTVIDLSMIERAQAQLREKERQYARLILSSRQGIMVHRDFKPVMLNQAWVDLMHAPSIDSVLKEVNLLDLLTEEEKTQAIERYQALMSGKIEGVYTVVENACFDGKKRYFNVYDNLVEWDGKPAIQAVIEDVTEKVELERELAYKAHHDSLTGLLNREAIYQWFADEEHQSQSLACLLLDIDDFKSVNDQYGHFSGDAMIRFVATVCRDVVADKGIVGRWGGEEFVVFLPDCRRDEALEVAETIRQRCASQACDYNPHWIQRTVSIGMTYSECEHAPSGTGRQNVVRQCMNDLIRRADQKLYQAKSQGKNQVVD
ncbi:sensor domain-containing diguanylate cyclase [Vibrio sp. CAU 1672]|uniref:sensor domain-containing diguanylate cyclase n=1 Tax=Vibrio sp. CAU 1672 TaxID=3032594 RepID=UPI0023DAE4B8|nr:sensor domain-containing diguanylate cyclase [Vibrio sp. CAU 1672]MDF2152819.1 sensor domain-containing diguanylate cyclase [Vibrio sp. CAU 1672]